MSEAIPIDVTITDQRKYVIGYSTVRKTRCEIYNFVSHTLRILRFTHGEAQWKVDDAIESFAAGDIVILNNLNKRNIHAILTDYIDYEMFDFYPSCLSDERLWHIFYRNVHKVANLKDAPKIGFLLGNLREEILRPRDAFQILSIHHLLDLLVLELVRHLEGGGDMELPVALFNVARSIQYLSEHFCDHINIHELAKLYGYSHEYFSRTFKKILGVSPVQYLVGLRLENVLHLVKAEQMPILSAAYQSGFQSSSAFYKAFHASYSLSPTQYMEKMNYPPN